MEQKKKEKNLIYIKFVCVSWKVNEPIPKKRKKKEMSKLIRDNPKKNHLTCVDPVYINISVHQAKKNISLLNNLLFHAKIQYIIQTHTILCRNTLYYSYILTISFKHTHCIIHKLTISFRHTVYIVQKLTIPFTHTLY